MSSRQEAAAAAVGPEPVRPAGAPPGQAPTRNAIRVTEGGVIQDPSMAFAPPVRKNGEYTQDGERSCAVPRRIALTPSRCTRPQLSLSPAPCQKMECSVRSGVQMQGPCNAALRCPPAPPSRGICTHMQ